MISEEDQKNLPDDENTPEKRTIKIWDFFGKKENGKQFFLYITDVLYTELNIHLEDVQYMKAYTVV